MDLKVLHDENCCLFYVTLAGRVALLQYKKTDEKTLSFEDTFVPPILRGRGIGTCIVTKAFEYAHKQGYNVITKCSFVEACLKKYIE